MTRLSLALLLTLLAAPALRAQSFQGLGFLPGGANSSSAHAVSADGAVVVGHGQIVGGSEAYRWTAGGGMVSLGDLPGGNTSALAYGASADGAVVVGVGDPVAGDEAWRWTAGGGMAGLGYLPGGGTASYAYGVSADGSVVVGNGFVGSSQRGFRWTQATGMVSLGDLPGGSTSSGASGVSADGSVVVGGSASGNGNEAYRWTQAGGMVGLGDLPGGAFGSIAEAVSADGAVVVGSGTGAGALQGFRWTAGGGMQPLAVLPGGNSGAGARAVSGDGQVVAGYQFMSGVGPRATVWSADGTVYDLRALLVGYGLDMTGWTLAEARGVSADGRVIVGTGNGPGGDLQAWRAVILPLPTAAEPGATADGLALTVAPNPARGAATVTLTLDAAQSATVTLYDLLGRPVAALHDGLLAAGPHAFRLDASALPAGVYVARAVTGGGIVTHRVTVVR